MYKYLICKSTSTHIEASLEVWSSYDNTVNDFSHCLWPFDKKLQNACAAVPLDTLPSVTPALVRRTRNCVEAKWPAFGELLVIVETKGSLYSSRDESTFGNGIFMQVFLFLIFLLCYFLGC